MCISYRDGFDDILITEEMYYYFHNNYYGKGDYENPNDGLEDLIFMTWLDDVYGRCAMGQFWDNLGTLDSLQTALDVIGIFSGIFLERAGNIWQKSWGWR